MDSIKAIRIFTTFDIYIPNVFSPNGDVANDTWIPYLDKSLGRIALIHIYNYNGDIIYECKAPNACCRPEEQFRWNGKYRDKDCNPGVFVYQIFWTDNNGNTHQEVGDVTLVR